MPIATTSFNQKIFAHASEADQYGPREGWFPLSYKSESDIFINGHIVTVQEQRARYLPLLSCERILKIALALLCTIASLGIALASKKIRRCFTGYQVVKIIREPSSSRSSSESSKFKERERSSEKDLRSYSFLPRAAIERLRDFSETTAKASPNLWKHYTNALLQYATSSPAVQQEILSIYIRDYTFESNKGASLQDFRDRFGAPPPMRDDTDHDTIHVWDNITQYALQILRERQGPLSMELMETLLLQLRAFFDVYPEQCLSTYPESKRTESQRDRIVSKRDRALATLWGHSGSLLTNHQKRRVENSFPIASPSYRERFPECTGMEFMSRVWLFTQTYFDFKHPVRGTEDAQNAIISALSGAYDKSGGITCHQGKCSHLAALVLYSRLDGMGDGDLKVPEGELAKNAAEEFFNDPDQGAKHRAILEEEMSFSETIQKTVKAEARLWHRKKGLSVDQKAFEAEVLTYARSYYIS